MGGSQRPITKAEKGETVRYQLDDHRYIDIRYDGDELVVCTDGSLAVFPLSTNRVSLTVAQ